jgi:NDP-sugar pyrophosphorylase family protein
MKAMILAAGLGTRLHPLTNDKPKALAEIAGRTLLEITLGRLRDFGISEVIVNVHHFADRVVEYLRAHDNFGMRIEISREDDLLDTGGGLMRASEFFLRDVNSRNKSTRDEPFVLHNVDVLSAIDLGAMVKFHCAQDALATLAVQTARRRRRSGRDGARGGADGGAGVYGDSRHFAAHFFVDERGARGAGVSDYSGLSAAGGRGRKDSGLPGRRRLLAGPWDGGESGTGCRGCGAEAH